MEDRGIYLDYQASTPVDPTVFSEMGRIATSCFGNPHASDHRFGWEAAEVVRDAANRISRALHATGYRVIFVSGATEGNNLAIAGLREEMLRRNRRVIAISPLEHACVQSAAQNLTKNDFFLKTLPCEANGVLVNDAVDRVGSEELGLVCVLSVSNEIGTVQPVKKLAAAAHSFGALFHCDAAQAVGKIRIDIADSDADAICISGHKCYGPKGIGALLIRDGLARAFEPQLLGGGQQGGLRSGTVPVELCAGLARAVELAVERQCEDEQSARKCREQFLIALRDAGKESPVINGELEHRVPHNINLRFAGLPAESILDAAPLVGVSRGAACSQEGDKVSPTLLALGLSTAEAEESLRISFGRQTSIQDANSAGRMLGDAVRQLRQIR